MNLPNRLTVWRIALTPVFVAALLLPNPPWGKTVALGVFIIACLTDWYDGRLARARKQETAFGALLDPVADKILTCAAFICFVELRDPHGHALVQAWMALVIVARDFLITGLRLVARERGVLLQAEQFGKHKTASQMATITFILIGLAARDEWGFGGGQFNEWFSLCVFWLMLVTVVLTVWSGWNFFWKNRAVVLRDA
ncbi:MAG: CDP-diacylglycerol--glycerol-3-phosphate 3-phosphatidyltransferase [Verrucomicrobiae bacterium]|nr:CDP-diacylglycerol--glycerol-3-phosphate 3-phosphatidyltransferase [Verrucomicrobiae bacterium]